jgi:hypothetical protein
MLLATTLVGLQTSIGKVRWPIIRRPVKPWTYSKKSDGMLVEPEVIVDAQQCFAGNNWVRALKH